MLDDQKFINGLRGHIGTSSSHQPFFTVNIDALRKYFSSETEKLAKDGITEHLYKGKMLIGAYDFDVEVKLTSDGSEKPAELIASGKNRGVFIAAGGNGILSEETNATKGYDAKVDISGTNESLAIAIGGNGIDGYSDEDALAGTKGEDGTDGGSAVIHVGDDSDAFGYSGNGGNGQQGARGKSPQNPNPGPKPDGAKVVPWSVVKAARVLTGTEKEAESSIQSGDGGNGGNAGNVTIRMKAKSFAEAVAGDGGNGEQPGLSLPDSGKGKQGKAGDGGTIDVEGGPDSLLSQKSCAGLKAKFGLEGNNGKWLIRIT